MVVSGEVGALDPVDNYIMHRFRAEATDKFWTEVQGASSNDKFYLKHPDDKGDHILVNDSFDIVGIIDWEWTRAVSKEEAFSSPCMIWPVNDFCNGSNELAEEEVKLAQMFEDRHRHDLACCVLNGRKIQRLTDSLENLNCSEPDSIKLFKGLRRAFDPSDDMEWDEWNIRALEKYRDDEVLKGLHN